MINFALLTPEMFDRKATINARTFTMFANACKGLSNLSSIDNLERVCLISKGCFHDDWVSGMFTQFINNNLDKLMEPEDILKKDWDTVKVMLEENIYKNNQYNASIASTLTVRFTNFIEDYFTTATDTKKSEKVIDRILDICTKSDKTLLSEDLIYKMIKTLNAKFSVRCQKLMKYPVIRAKIL